MNINRNFKNVIPYRRWSTLEQGNSDKSSDDRQIANTHAFCREQGWTVTHFDAVDAGKSAYTGANLTKGILGKLTTQLLTGALDPHETVIVVEELDRLSRQPPGRMTAWMQPLLMAGVTFAVSNTRQIVTEASMNDFGQFVSLMSQAFSGYEFSRRQQNRGNGAWNKRRDAAREGRNIARHRARGWLVWDEATKTYREIDDRVWLVGEAFRLHVEERKGKGEIAKLFNLLAVTDERYRAFSSSKVQPKLWTATAIGRILHDPAVTGFIQYHNNPRGADKKVPVGDPVKVYPEIISPELFARANEKRHVEQLRHKGRGTNISNLLGPIARCSECGGTMQPLGSSRWRVAKDGTRSQHYYLYCQTNKMSRGEACTNARGWPYASIETPILDKLLRLAIDDQHFRTADGEVARLEGNVVRLQRQLEDQQKRAKVMLATIGEDAMDFEREAYETAKRNIRLTMEGLATAQAELGDAKGQVSPAEHIVRVAEVRERMDSDNADERYTARLLTKTALRGIIDEITFFHGADPWGGPEGLVWVELLHGIGNLMIWPGREPVFTESGDMRENEAKSALNDARGNVDQIDRIQAYMRRRAG